MKTIQTLLVGIMIGILLTLWALPFTKVSNIAVGKRKVMFVRSVEK